MEIASRKYAEINARPFTQWISAQGVLVHIPILEESVHDAQCVVTAQLQLQPSVAINISITMLVNHTATHPRIVPKVCIEVSQKDRGFISFNASQGMTNFFHELKLKCMWVWAVYLHRIKGAVQQLQDA